MIDAYESLRTLLDEAERQHSKLVCLHPEHAKALLLLLERCRIAMNPGRWTSEPGSPGNLWHTTIPDFELAFSKLRAWAFEDDRELPK